MVGCVRIFIGAEFVRFFVSYMMEKQLCTFREELNRILDVVQAESVVVELESLLNLVYEIHKEEVKIVEAIDTFVKW